METDCLNTYTVIGLHPDADWKHGLRDAPVVLVEVRGGNVEQVTACGDVRVMVLDHDNPSFDEDAVDDSVDAAMMERLIACVHDQITAHEQELDR